MSEHVPHILQMMAAAPPEKGKAPMARREDDKETGSYFDAVRGLMHEISQAVARLDVHIDWCTHNQKEIKEQLCGLKRDHKSLRRMGLIFSAILIGMTMFGVGPIFRGLLRHYTGISFTVDGG